MQQAARFDPTQSKTEWQTAKHALMFYESELSRGLKIGNSIMYTFWREYVHQQGRRTFETHGPSRHDDMVVLAMRECERDYAKARQELQVCRQSAGDLMNYFIWFLTLEHTYGKKMRDQAGVLEHFVESMEHSLYHCDLFRSFVDMLPPTLRELDSRYKTEPGFRENFDEYCRCFDADCETTKRNVMTMIDAVGENLMRQRETTAYVERGGMR